MKFNARNLFCASSVFLALFISGAGFSYALDSKFEIDTKSLVSKPDNVPGKQGEPSSKRVAKHSGKHHASHDIKDGTERKRPHHVKTGKTHGVSKTASRSRHGRRKFVSNRVYRADRTSETGRDRKLQTLHLTMSPKGGSDLILQARSVWGKLVDDSETARGPYVARGKNFSLSLDPSLYPMFPAADGGKIIVDTRDSLPPLVRTILHEQDPKVRVVSGNTENRKWLFSSIIDAAKFYSVEENFTIGFGTDPKLTITSDFKIEKSTESLLNNDVILLNVEENRAGIPSPLVDFLGKEGFRVVDMSAMTAPETGEKHRLLYTVTGKDRQSVVDSLLAALSIRSMTDKEIALDTGSMSGVSLSVRADRYCGEGDKKLVISFSDADPVQYTLLKILEMKGYQVVAIYPGDDFRKISEKLFSALKIPAFYGMHYLWNPGDAPFDVQLSGFVLKGEKGNGENTFVTDVEIDPLVRQLAAYEGYSVIQ